MITLLALLALQSPAPGPDSLALRVDAWRAAHEGSLLAEFRAMLSRPNVASSAAALDSNMAFLEGALRRRGLATRRLEAPGVMPALYGERLTVPGDPTVVIYAHADGQPVDPAAWTTPPFTPTLRAAPGPDGLGRVLPWPVDGGPGPGAEARIYARSASDDRGPIMELLGTLDALDALGVPLSVNLKVFLEGGEEAGSRGLLGLVTAHRDLLRSDLWLLIDGPMHASGRLQLILGARGVLDANLTVFGPRGDLHSGHYGNFAPNPNARLAHLIAAMRDDDGRILIPGAAGPDRGGSAIADELAAALPSTEALARRLGVAASEGGVTPAEAVLRPALNVSGWSGGGVGSQGRNIVPASATAFLDFRLVPGQSVPTVRAAVERFVGQQGYHLIAGEPTEADRRTYPRLARLRWSEGYEGAWTPSSRPAVQAVAHLVEAATGERPVLVPLVGGSLPLAHLVVPLRVPFVILPTVNADNNQHAADENLRLGNLWRGMTILAEVLADYGASR